ncbi:MAG: hypothetical protein ACKN9V_03590, partial [Pseudomonadota bacterium]
GYFGGLFINEKSKEGVLNQNISRANSLTSDFFAGVSTSFRRQQENVRLEGFATPVLESGNEIAKQLTIKSQNSTGALSEIISNQCLSYPNGLASLRDLGVTPTDEDEMRRCSGCGSGTLPQAISNRDSRVIQALPGNLTGIDNLPITAVVCLRVNGNITPTAPQDIRMTLITLVPFFTGNRRQAKVIKSQVILPAKEIRDDSIKILRTVKE